MKILNLVPKYIETISKEKSLKKYFSQFPDLFEHYFTFWSDKNISFVTDLKTIKNGEQLILDNIDYIEKKLKHAELPVETIKVVLFVGQDVSNGHAAYLDNEWWVWVPVETYASKIQVDAFLPHEIIHGIHYSMQPDFYFSTRAEKDNTSRQIITEGLATLGTMQVMEMTQYEATWADFLDKEDYNIWLNQYEERRLELLEFVIENWDKGAKNLFQANDQKDILKFRIGYLVALKAIEGVFSTTSLSKMLEVNRAHFSMELLKYLKKERDQRSRS